VNKRLLIVEDNELNRDLLVQLFENTYELAIAEDGETAVELATAQNPHVVLMDIGLPGMSGIDSVRAIRALSDVPIVAVSSRVMPGEREEALEAGCDDFVAKPFDDQSLVRIVTRLAEGR
jgi:CheY-like chemotaxis protein